MALLRSSDRVAGLLLNPLLPFPGNIPGDLLASSLLRWNTATNVRELAGARAVAFHLMSPFEWPSPSCGALPRHLLGTEVPLIVTLYDLIPYLMPERYLVDPHRRAQYMERIEVVRSADLILAISEATRRNAIRELGIASERVQTIGGGVSAIFQRPTSRPAARDAVSRSIAKIVRPYVFALLGAEPRKNAERLLEAYGRLPRRLRRSRHLVITCALPAEWRERWIAHALESGCERGDVVLTGQVPDALLVALFQGAELFVFPSLYEGFGLPVVEAIACGAPSVTSNTSSLPEILDHEAACFDPYDVADIARVVERGLTDEAFREELARVAAARAPGFTWDLVARRTVEAVAGRIDTRPRVRSGAHYRGRAMTVALVTPLPPTRSGVAAYSNRIASDLARRVKLDIFYPRQQSPPANAGRGVGYLPLACLGRSVDPYSYDVVVYVLGNSEHHVETYRAALRYPGVVWLHDVRLPNIYRFLALEARAPEVSVVREQLLRFYGDRAPAVAMDKWNPTMVDRFGIGLTPELVHRARKVIVHSRLAEQLLVLDQGPDVRHPPVSVIPLAASQLRAEGPIRRRWPPVVGTLGIVSERKLPLLLIDAIAEIPAADRPHLRFVGPCSERERALIVDRANSRRIADLVQCVGEVDDAGWWSWIEAFTCVVQLRAATNGEAAASLRDAMACGVPALTNMLRAEEEFPSGSLVTLPAALDAATLAAEIRRVCTREAEWAALSAGAWKYSATVTTEVVAAQLVRELEATVGV